MRLRIMGETCRGGAIHGAAGTTTAPRQPMTTTATRQTACVWWSTTRCAWGCQIGNERSWHYSEAAAIAHGQQLADDIQRCSAIRTF